MNMLHFLFILALAHAFAVPEDEDCAVSLLQQGFSTNRRNALVTHQKGSFEDLATFDCTEHPQLCQAPFNCQAAEPSRIQWGTIDGPNMQIWCNATAYEDYVAECLVKKEMVSAGHIQYESTVAGNHGKFTAELDGSYCFIEGHCLNTAVTNSTTLEEANHMCDQRYGHERWTSFGSLHSQDKLPSAMPANPANGFTAQEQTTPFLLAACAMGNYHCDVVYCKETYCKNDYYVQKYGHFLDDLGWTSSTVSWMHA